MKKLMRKTNKKILKYFIPIMMAVLVIGLTACSSGAGSGSAAVQTNDISVDSSVVDPTALEQAIASANELHEEDYEYEEWQEFWQVYTYADDVLTRGTTQAELDEAADSLNAAIQKLNTGDSTVNTGKIPVRVIVIVVICVVVIVVIVAVYKKKKKNIQKN